MNRNLQGRARQSAALTRPDTAGTLNGMPQALGAGQPKTYAGMELEIAIAIAERLKTGEPMAVICREPDMPAHDTVTSWREKWPEIERIIARARSEGYDAIALDALQIADDGRNDTQTDEDGNVVVAQDVIARSKLRVETRLKLLAKWDPKRYGDQPTANVVNLGVQINTGLSEEERAGLMAKKQASLARRRKAEAERVAELGEGPATGA